MFGTFSKDASLVAQGEQRPAPAMSTDSSQETGRTRTPTVSGERDAGMVDESPETAGPASHGDAEDPLPGAAGWAEAEAFASVHDLVHYAILSQPGRRATLRQIYTTCEEKGRIAYKHGKGSRLIIANEHWKSQIRHALYTSPRWGGAG